MKWLFWAAFVLLFVDSVFAFSMDYQGQTDSDYASFVRNHTFINFSISNSTTVDVALVNWNGTNITVWGDGLIGLWHLDNSTVDGSGHGNDAQFNDGVSCGADDEGRFGSGCELDGVNDDIVLPNQVFVNDHYSFEFWFKANDTSVDRDFYTRYAANAGFRGFIESGGAISIDWNNGGSWAQLNSAPGSVKKGVWQHQVVTYNSSHLRLYLDNNLTEELEDSGSLTLGWTSIKLGETALAPINFNGSFDEVRVWNKTLSADEISILYRTNIGRYYANITENNASNYTYYAWANQTDGTTNQTTLRHLILNAPAKINTTITYPPDGTVLTNSNVSINYTTNNTENQPITYYIYLNTSFNRTTTTNTSFNLSNGAYTVNVSAFAGGVWGVNATTTFTISCVSTWACTGWVKNGSKEYRQCNQLNSCLVPNNVPDEGRYSMESLIMVLIPIFISIIFMAAAFLVNEIEHSVLKYLFMLVSLIMSVSVLNFAFVLQNTDFETPLTNMLHIIIVLLFFIFSYYVYYFFIKIVTSINRRKIEKLEY